MAGPEAVSVLLTYTNLALQLMMGEASHVAARLELAEAVPITLSSLTNFQVWEPNKGLTVEGTLSTTNYDYQFMGGLLTRLDKAGLRDHLVQFDETYQRWAEMPLLIDTNQAFQLVTQRLAKLSVDWNDFQRAEPWVFQHYHYSRGHVTGNFPEIIKTQKRHPLYYIQWRDNRIPFFTAKVLGTTRELMGFEFGLSADVEKGNIFSRPVLQITNALDFDSRTYFLPANIFKRWIGSDEAIAILRRPTRVTARLFSPFTPEGSPPTEQFRSKTRVVRAELGNKLGKLLSTPESYTKWETMKLCIFEPAVRFQVYRGRKSVEVDVCFKCEELIIRFENHEAAEDFDAIQPELLKITKQIFPGDKIISPIKPNPDAKKERSLQK